jgi:hypothetical protein
MAIFVARIDSVLTATWILVAIGILGLILAYFRKERPRPKAFSKMSQRGGKGSKNIQAGGDINVDSRDEE